MKAEITFSIRDWKRGQNCLQQLALKDEQELMTDTFNIELEDEEHLQELREELNARDIEIIDIKQIF
jgi:hypothetical protein